VPRSRQAARQPIVVRARTIASVCLLAGAIAATVTISPAWAQPSPSATGKRLADQLEKLTEQYNRYQVQLQQAQRAAKVAADGAVRQEQDYQQARAKIVQLAADSYKNGGGLDPAVALATTSDPQSLLDRSATLNFFAQHNSTQAQVLYQTLQATTRARKAAQERTDQVRQLSEQLARQQKALQVKIGQSGITPAKATSAGSAPSVPAGGASAKALGAVKAALAVRGTPYSWGGGGPTGPTYGTAQGRNIKGFDCSGLTLYAYAQVGIKLPHYTGDQVNAGVRVSKSNLRPGDLVFFYSDLHHMGMYIGNGQMIHAPETGDVVKISPIAGRPFAAAVRIA
jgi:cell wall-associated NlpC family hydrolase